jgi:sugar diacid utilization regulator
MNANSLEIDSVVNLLSDQYNYSDVSVINQLINEEKELFFIVLSASDMNGIEPELLEIIKNSAAVKHITKYEGNLIVLVEEQNIYEVCSDLQKNIFTELYVETVIAIGGRLEQPLQLGDLYRNCNEAMLLKQCYGVNLKVLDDQSMLLYRMIASIQKDQKGCIVNKIFSSKFIELLNSEMELTIEEMFKNNLNLTDTSSRLYIHRNTLLYRIEKIHKLTGFDLRKFEDSMIFKLAWLMYKEKQI